MNRVGTGSVCQAGLQSVWGTPVAPDTLLNMTGESIKTTVEKGDEPSFQTTTPDVVLMLLRLILFVVCIFSLSRETTITFRTEGRLGILVLLQT